APKNFRTRDDHAARMYAHMPLTERPLTLSKLYGNPIFQSEQRAETHEEVSKELTDHLLRWKRGKVDAMMCKGQLKALRMYILRYGAEVEVRPRPFEDFSLLHTSLKGGAEIEVDGKLLYVAEGRAALLSPRQDIRLRWHAGTEQLILRVPHAIMRDVAALEPDAPLCLSPGMLLGKEQTVHWELLSQCLLSILQTAEASPFHGAWVDHFERNVALFLLAQQSSASERPPAPPPIQEVRQHPLQRPGSKGQMESLMEFIDLRIYAPISLEDMANVAGVSPRMLNVLCHQHHGVSPMALLRKLRLDAVRTKLLLHPDANIGETALALGFGHLGRFARYYQERFGERPTQTRDRQR
ncbi:MAG: AraC family transcriptional regulator, partial [Burkholderiaceae bacterium]|nr:AraC family transcriptional regulator [Burkholderiaceae bacterium]